MLSSEEGVKGQPYDDKTGKTVHAPVGNLTIGIGHNLEARPLSPDSIRVIFNEDLVNVMQDASDILLFFSELSENRQLAIINMIFNMGAVGFRGWQPTIALMKIGSWEEVYNHIVSSLWAKELPARSNRVALMFKDDSFPYEG